MNGLILSAAISERYNKYSQVINIISLIYFYSSIIKISLFLCVSFQDIGKVEKCASQNRERAISPLLKKFTNVVHERDYETV